MSVAIYVAKLIGCHIISQRRKLRKWEKRIRNRWGGGEEQGEKMNGIVEGGGWGRRDGGAGKKSRTGDADFILR